MSALSARLVQGVDTLIAPFQGRELSGPGEGGAGRAPPHPQWEASEIQRFQGCRGLLRLVGPVVTPESSSPNILILIFKPRCLRPASVDLAKCVSTSPESGIISRRSHPREI